MSYILIESGPLQEPKIEYAKKGKAIFRMVMQDADTPNQNKRIYPKPVLSEAIKMCEQRIKSRALTGELDHPIPTGTHVDSIRQTTVQLKEVSHIMRTYEWDGNFLLGEFETLGTPNGEIVYTLIREKTGIGVSMRGLADLERRQDFNIVKSPLVIICYDMVSRPSHQSAVIDPQKVKFEEVFPNLLKESASGNTICTPDGKCYLSDYFDKLVEKKIIRLLSSWV